MHLDLDHAVALARLAAPALDVEREAPGPVAARLRLGQAGEPVADRGEAVGVGGGVRARRAPDRRLVDVDHLVEELDALDLVVGAGEQAGLVQAARQRRIQRVQDQGRLAAAGHAGDAGEGAERDRDLDVLQVVLARAGQLQPAAALGLPAQQGQGDLPAPDQVLPGQALGRRHDRRRRALGDHHAAVHPGAGAHVDHVVGGQDRLLVVLDHDHRVAEVAQALERVEQALVVALMQADRGLVQDVEHAGQARADLRGETDALALAARERAGIAGKRQVAETDVLEKARGGR